MGISWPKGPQGIELSESPLKKQQLRCVQTAATLVVHKLGRVWKRPGVSGGSAAEGVTVAAPSNLSDGLGWPGGGPVMA